MAGIDHTTYKEVSGSGIDYISLIGWLGVFAAAGVGSAFYMETQGHIVTGMNNQIVWGLPHVFAVFLIVAASGALNVASMSSVFGKKIYKPLGRLSAIMAIALLAGGLMVLMLDLGRPDRIDVAMLKQNFKSIFAWNIYLYSGFFVVVIVYLWMMMERRFNKYSKIAGTFAFVWRLALTTGTGSIFGFLVARPGYDAAIMAPLFIAMSFSFGLAIKILFLTSSYRATNRELGDKLLFQMRNLLGIFIAAALYFTVAQHLTNLYAPEHSGIEQFLLVNGGIYTMLFWLGQVILGSIVPMALVFHPATKGSYQAINTAAMLAILGGFAQVYIIIIGGQAYPLEMFPGFEVTSTFFDGSVHSYTPSLPEFVLGFGGVATALLIMLLAVKYLPILPASLSDQAIGPANITTDEDA